MTADGHAAPIRTLIVDDEPLAVERLQVICAQISELVVVGTASDGAAALRLAEALTPDLILLDVSMPEMDGISVAQRLAGKTGAPAVVFVTAFDNFAVKAFDLEAVDYVLKPVAPDRLSRAVARTVARRVEQHAGGGAPDTDFWIPHKSELIRVAAADIDRIDAERDYVRLHVGDRSYLLLHTIAGLEQRLDPGRFIRVHRSVIVRRDRVIGLRHDGMGVWSAELVDGSAVRIGRTYLSAAKAMAGR